MNGSVKVILVGGFSLVFGFYASMIQGINNRIILIGDQKSYYTQARMNSTAGLNHAIYTMKSEQNWWYIWNGVSITKTNLLVGGDTVSYVVDQPSSLPSNQARVTVTGKFGGVVAKQITIIKNISSSGPYSFFFGSNTYRCQVEKVYLYPYQFPS